MARETIYEVPGFVEVTVDDELDAIWIKWHDPYDEGTRLRDAVEFCFDYVRKTGMVNWVADMSVSVRGLSEGDKEWTGVAFKQALAETPVKKMVLVPPAPGSGLDVSALDSWEANARTVFAGRVEPKLSSDADEIRAFFLG